MHELEFFVKHVRVISAVQPCGLSMIYGDSLSSLSLVSELSGGISLYSLAHGMAVVTFGSTSSSRAGLY